MIVNNFQSQKNFKSTRLNSFNVKLTEQDRKQAISLIDKIHTGLEKLEEILNNEDKVFKLIISIIFKSSRQRTEEDLDILSKIVSQNQFFQQILEREDGQGLLLSSCQKLSYLFIPTGHAIFKEGDIADNFYFIIRGQIRVSKIIGDLNEDHTLTYLNSGKSFGEKALINDCLRTASVWTVEDSYLAVLSKEDFKSFTKNLKNKKQEIYYEEFSSLNCVKNWPFYIQKQLFDKSFYETVGMDYQVYHEGDCASKVYFIHSGEFKMTKSTQFNDEETSNIQQIVFPQIQEKNLTSLSLINKRDNSDNQYNYRNTTVKVMEIGQLFGDLELFHEEFRQTSVRTNCEINSFYWIPKCLFLPIISQDKKLVETLKGIIEIKRQLVLSTIENLHRFMKLMKQETKPYESQNQKNIRVQKKTKISIKNIIQENIRHQTLNNEKVTIPLRTLSSVNKHQNYRNQKFNLQISSRFQQYSSSINEQKCSNRPERYISLSQNPVNIKNNNERNLSQQSQDFYAYSLKIFTPKILSKKQQMKQNLNISHLKIKPLKFENSFIINSHSQNLVPQDYKNLQKAQKHYSKLIL